MKGLLAPLFKKGYLDSILTNGGSDSEEGGEEVNDCRTERVETLCLDDAFKASLLCVVIYHSCPFFQVLSN